MSDTRPPKNISSYEDLPKHYREDMEKAYGVACGFPDPESQQEQNMKDWILEGWRTGNTTLPW